MLVYKQTNILIVLTAFVVSGFLLRLFLSDFDLERDGALYYRYAYTLAFEGRYPEELTKLHNLGWVFLLVPFFKIIGTNSEMLHFAQHMISITISTATIPLSYLFARRFIPNRYALVVPLLFAIDFRMAQNSTFGIIEPLAMILSLAAYSTKNRLLMFSFVGLACIVRFEAIMLIPVLFVIHRDKKMLPYIVIPIFVLVLLFVLNDPVGHPDQFVAKSTKEINFTKNMTTVKSDRLLPALANSIVYMVWAAFPTFTLSIYGIIKHRWIIIVLALLCISGLYAYIDAYDTRYFFPMYPFLALASAYTFQRIVKGTS